jgi:hypothetical protein
MMEPLRYFAYGSNMSGPRLAARIDSMRKLAVARLDGHRLCFHKVSTDGSAKCNVHPSTHPDHHVIGVLFEIDRRERPILDRYEGLGRGYEIKQVTLALVDGARLDAFTYYATHVDDQLLPYDWYKAHVLHGALEHGLPADYVAAIRTVATMPDPDPWRQQRELGIYR